MEHMFAEVNGNAKTKLPTVLQLIDDRLIDSTCALTTEQTEFLRSVTLFAYTTGCASDIKSPDVGWLLTRFQSEPTPQRALMIALLIHCDKLSPDIQSMILMLLSGTPGERFLDTGDVANPESKPLPPQ